MSLLMALVLMVGILAVPAMAADSNEGIELYGPARCRICGADPSSMSYAWDTIYWGQRTSKCTQGASGCSGDYTAKKFTGERCNACANVLDGPYLAEVGVYCPGWGNYFYA